MLPCCCVIMCANVQYKGHLLWDTKKVLKPNYIIPLLFCRNFGFGGHPCMCIILCICVFVYCVHCVFMCKPCSYVCCCSGVSQYLMPVAQQCRDVCIDPERDCSAVERLTLPQHPPTLAASSLAVLPWRPNLSSVWLSLSLSLYSYFSFLPLTPSSPPSRTTSFPSLSLVLI